MNRTRLLVGGIALLAAVGQLYLSTPDNPAGKPPSIAMVSADRCIII
ncbi:hypothetical protein AB0G54_12910 [Streptomyces yokosukanensis]|nr:hypothetical protein [Streptomyces yokosukanensis]